MVKTTKVGIYKIIPVPDRKMQGYEGMNPSAGHVMGFNAYHLHKNQIAYNKHYKGATKRQIIKHEIVEYQLMQKGMPYFKAHAIANKSENLSYKKILKVK